MIRRWKDFLQNKTNICELVFALIVAFTPLLMAPAYLGSIEPRPGIRLSDYILDLFPVVDVSLPIMYTLYVGLGITIIYIIAHPKNFILALKCHFLTNVGRYGLIYLLPLEPPADLIILRDPLLEMLIYESKFITKDLFYSGHTSMAFVMFFCVDNKYLKVLMGIIAFTVPVMLMMQRIHYSYDVLFAPFATYICYRIAKLQWFPDEGMLAA